MNIDNVIRKMERKSKLITVRVTPTVFNGEENWFPTKKEAKSFAAKLRKKVRR